MDAIRIDGPENVPEYVVWEMLEVGAVPSDEGPDLEPVGKRVKIGPKEVEIEIVGYETREQFFARLDAAALVGVTREGFENCPAPYFQVVRCVGERDEVVDVRSIGTRISPDLIWEISEKFLARRPSFFDDDVDLWAGHFPVWTVGRRIADGKVFASLVDEFYLNPNFDCLYLR